MHWKDYRKYSPMLEVTACYYFNIAVELSGYVNSVQSADYFYAMDVFRGYSVSHRQIQDSNYYSIELQLVKA